MGGQVDGEDGTCAQDIQDQTSGRRYGFRRVMHHSTARCCSSGGSEGLASRMTRRDDAGRPVRSPDKSSGPNTLCSITSVVEEESAGRHDWPIHG